MLEGAFDSYVLLCLLEFCISSSEKIQTFSMNVHLETWI